jgi:hypothetical protein
MTLSRLSLGRSEDKVRLDKSVRRSAENSESGTRRSETDDVSVSVFSVSVSVSVSDAPKFVEERVPFHCPEVGNTRPEI